MGHSCQVLRSGLDDVARFRVVKPQCSKSQAATCPNGSPSKDLFPASERKIQSNIHTSTHRLIHVARVLSHGPVLRRLPLLDDGRRQTSMIFCLGKLCRRLERFTKYGEVNNPIFGSRSPREVQEKT